MRNLKKRIQMNLFAEQKYTRNLWKTSDYQRGQVGAGRRGPGVWDWHTLTGVSGMIGPQGPAAQRPLPSTLWSSTWEKNLKENGCVYTYKWVTLLCNRNDHNIVNQIYFTSNFKKKVAIFFFWQLLTFCSPGDGASGFTLILALLFGGTNHGSSERGSCAISCLSYLHINALRAGMGLALLTMVLGLCLCLTPSGMQNTFWTNEWRDF